MLCDVLCEVELVLILLDVEEVDVVKDTEVERDVELVDTDRLVDADWDVLDNDVEID